MFYLGQYGRYSILDVTYKSCLLFGAIWKVFNTGRNIQILCFTWGNMEGIHTGCNIQILCFTWGNMEGIQYWMQHTNLVFYLGQYGRYSILGVTYSVLLGAIWKVFNTGCNIQILCGRNIQILCFTWGNMEGIQYWM